MMPESDGEFYDPVDGYWDRPFRDAPGELAEIAKRILKREMTEDDKIVVAEPDRWETTLEISTISNEEAQGVVELLEQEGIEARILVSSPIYE